MLQVSVPATSANLGPGVDCVGLALDLYNHFYFLENNEPLPQGAHILSTKSLCHQAFKKIVRQRNQRYYPPRVALMAGVPKSRGLGSSATLTLAGLIGANHLCGFNLDPLELLEWASQLEGHPDNVAPALWGGMVLSIKTSSGLVSTKIKLYEDLQVVVAVPDFELPTAIARQALPQNALWSDAVKNIGRFGLFINALTTGEYRHLAMAMEDYLHQPYRLSLVPGLKEVMGAALQAGALGSCLSGAGPSILAFCQKASSAVSEAMYQQWQKEGITARVYVLNIAHQGILVRPGQ